MADTIRSLLVSAASDVSEAKTKLDAITSILQPVAAVVTSPAVRPEDVAAINAKIDAVAAKIDAIQASLSTGSTIQAGPTVDDVKAIVAAATSLVVAKLDAITAEIGTPVPTPAA